MIRFQTFFLLIFLFLSQHKGVCQRIYIDSTEKKVVPNPEINKKEMSQVKKAMLFSIIPGGGQIYNGKVWKVPIIYVGFGLLTYSYVFYNQVYSDVRTSYIQKLNGQVVTDPEYANVPEEMLYSLRESYRKSRDLSAIGIVGWYAFNLIDAAVDAHLKEFDVGDKLSMRIQPDFKVGPVYSYTGLNVRLRF